MLNLVLKHKRGRGWLGAGGGGRLVVRRECRLRSLYFIFVEIDNLLFQMLGSEKIGVYAS